VCILVTCALSSCTGEDASGVTEYERQLIGSWEYNPDTDMYESTTNTYNDDHTFTISNGPHIVQQGEWNMQCDSIINRRILTSKGCKTEVDTIKTVAPGEMYIRKNGTQMRYLKCVLKISLRVEGWKDTIYLNF